MGIVLSRSCSMRLGVGVCRRAARLGKEAALRGLMESGQGQKVALDCSLDHHMTDKELKATAVQVMLTYSANLRAPRPFHLFLTGLKPNGRVHHALKTHIKNFDSCLFDIRQQPHHEVFRPQDIVYLTPDSDTDLEEVDSTKVYVIGGFVDLTINKRLTLFKAQLAGVSTARLPIAKYMYIKIASQLSHHLNLPINIVVSILLDVHSGISWPQALLTHLPKRKGYCLKEEPPQ